MLLWQQTLLTVAVARAIALDALWDTVVSQPQYNGSTVVDIKNPVLTSSAERVTGRFGDQAFGFGGTRILRFSPPAFILHDDFTIEGHVRFDSLAADNQCIVDVGANGLAIRHRAASGWAVTFGTSQVLLGNLPAAIQPQVGDWYHVALVRRRQLLSLYIQGTEVGSVQFADSVTANACTYGNSGANTTSPFTGTLSQPRISLIARYTSNFTVPSTAFAVGAAEADFDVFADRTTLLLRVQSGQVVDQSTGANVVEAVGGAGISSNRRFDRDTLLFNGTSAFYRLPNTNSQWNLGADEFAIECDVFPTTERAAGTTSFLVGRRDGASYGGFCLGLNGLRPAAYFGNSASSWSVSLGNISNSELPLNAWSSVALVRQGSEFRLYVNGEILGTGAIGGNLVTSTMPLSIGAANNGLEPFAGNIGCVRITRGLPRYAAPFTPKLQKEFATRLPTALELADVVHDPYADATSTYIPFAESLREYKHNILPTITGSVDIVNTNPIFGHQYLHFNTGANGLAYNVSRAMLGAKDFTIEMHVRANYTPTTTTLALACQWATGASGIWMMGIRSGTLAFWYTANSALFSDTTIADNNWHHVAVTRSNGALRLFVDGVLERAFTTTQNLSYPSALQVGLQPTRAPTGYECSVANLAITSGVARYTSSFTPPTAPRTSVSIGS